MCDEKVHNTLKDEMNEYECPFCDELLIKGNKKADPCCNEQNIETFNDLNVCISCGKVQSYNYYTEFVNFYDNIYKINRQSIYFRKYHFQNTLNSLQFDKGLELTHNQRGRIYKVFDAIGAVLNNVNGNRKRMISTKFIIWKILKMMKIPCDQINISRSKRTLQYYEKYFSTIMSLIGDKIQSILV